jgi:hypothetical protein
VAQKPGDRKNEARERARVRREEQRKAERRRQLLTSGGVVLAVIAVVVAIVVVKITTSSSNKNANLAVTTTVAGGISGVPAANFDAAGTGTATGGVAPVSGQPALTANGKPEVLYIGAEYCPYCAAERWAIATALSRFGTFSGLQTTMSSSTDIYPSTATLSFLTATYQSDYLSLVTREIQDRSGKKLQTLTTAETATFAALAPKGGIPFLDIGNKYFLNGTQYDPAVLKGLTANQIAQQLSNPTSAVGKGVLGSANQLTAAICTVTDNKPAAVCTSSGVTAAAKTLTSGSTSGSSS